MGSEKTLKKLGRKGVMEILYVLFEIWKEWKEGAHERESPATTFSYIEKNISKRLRLSTRTLNEGLKLLDELRLIRKYRNTYSITDLGLFVYPTMETIEKIASNYREQITFSMNKDPRSWYREIAALIVGARYEIMITTRQLRTFSHREVHQAAFDAFKDAANRDIKIRMIADPLLPRTTHDIFLNKFNAEIRFLPRSVLENPPKILKPIFLEDFGHVMICDRLHWLYLLPHEKETEHEGTRCLNDPIVAAYLSKIFDTFWKFAETK